MLMFVSQQIIFRASCWGSDVSFVFDFDDGTRLEKKVSVSSRHGISASVAHRFMRGQSLVVTVDEDLRWLHC